MAEPPAQEATLTLPDGRSVKIPILYGTNGPPVLNISNLYALTGMFTHDPGFTATSSCTSSICFIDGELGELWYRGYPVQELASNCSFLEVCYLLLNGELPGVEALERFEDQVIQNMCIHEKLLTFYKSFQQGAHPMAILVGVIGALSAFLHHEIDVNDPKARQAAAILMVAKIPFIAAMAYRTAMGLPPVYPRKKYTYVENFLYMMFSDPMSEEFEPDPVIVNALEKIMILHADHEQNASTSTVRIAGSSMANPFACIAAGVASLWGPMHGGANEAVLEMLEGIGSVDKIPEFLDKVKNHVDGVRLMGFGHRVYKTRDPRNQIMSQICHQVVGMSAKPSGLLELALELERVALADEYFIKRKLYPNVDYYSGIVLTAIGVPRSMFTVIFALGRTIGWVTQWKEMMSEPVKKISRPRQLYIGANQRSVVPIGERPDVAPEEEDQLTGQREVWSPKKSRRHARPQPS